MQHPSFAQSLETSMVCEIPFEILDDLSGKMPKLRQQIMRLMSNEIKGDQEMILLLSKKNGFVVKGNGLSAEFLCKF